MIIEIALKKVDPLADYKKKKQMIEFNKQIIRENVCISELSIFRIRTENSSTKLFFRLVHVQ